MLSTQKINPSDKALTPHQPSIVSVSYKDGMLLTETGSLGEMPSGDQFSQQLTTTFWPNHLETYLVIESLLKVKRHKRLRTSTLETYEKRLRHFQQAFPRLTTELDPLLEYLAQFDGETGRYQRDRQDLLTMLYRHATNYFGLLHNPLQGLPRPQLTRKPIKTLSLSQVALVDAVAMTTTERAVWELLAGHGWRQIEVRRITASDVRDISDGMIWCRGKERDELTPLLPSTQILLQLLAEDLADDEPVIRSTRIRAGGTQPLGEDGMSQLVARLFRGAEIRQAFKGHDLRRTFATLVRVASGDEFLAMRLIRDTIPGLSSRYINFSTEQLVQGLTAYSPLQRIKSPFLSSNQAQKLVETGESRTPRPEEAAQNILQA